MEITQINDKINKSIELNNLLLKLHKSYSMYCQDFIINNKIKFIGSIIDNDILLLRIEYIILGSFSKTKNVWIWADQSQSINKKTKNIISDLRTEIIQIINSIEYKTSNLDSDLIKKLQNFCVEHYLVMSISELSSYLYYISIIISTKNKESIFLTTTRGNIIDVLIVQQILFNNIKYAN